VKNQNKKWKPKGKNKHLLGRFWKDKLLPWAP